MDYYHFCPDEQNNQPTSPYYATIDKKINQRPDFVPPVLAVAVTHGIASPRQVG